MGIPATLSSVPAVTPYIQYVAANGQTVFPYPFPITQDADLVVVINGVTQATDSGYTLTGQGNPTGGNLTFTAGRTGGDIVTLFRDIAIQRVTQIAQNSGYSSTAFNAEFNNIYLILQQLQESIALSLQIPNTNNPAPTTTLTPTAYAGKYLSFDSNGNPTPAALTSSGSLTGAIIASLLNLVTTTAPIGDRVRTPQEITNNITPSNFSFKAPDVRRYNVPTDGVTDCYATLNAVSMLPLEFPEDTKFVVNTNLTLTDNVVFKPGATLAPANNVWVKFTGRVQETGQSILAAGAAGNVLLTNDPQYSYANLTLNVVAVPVNPNDFSTIQSAVNAIPRFNQGHVLTINVADGTWNETPDIHNKHANDSSPSEFMIIGDAATPSNVVVHGAIFRDCSGYLYPKVSAMQFSGGLGSTGGDECVVMALGCQRVSLANCIIDGTGLGASPPADVGVMAYAGNIDIQQMTINNCHNRTKTKHGGTVNNTQLAIQSPTGIINSFVSGGGNGVSTDIKGLGYQSATHSPLPDSANFGKSLSQGFTYDQYTGALSGPGFFMSSTTVHEDYFTSIDGYTVANTGDGSTSVGTDGLAATVNTGLVKVTFSRAGILASPSLQRPLMFLTSIKLTTLVAGTTIYIGVGWPVPGAGDFIGFKITTAGISGVVRKAGTEVATSLVAGNPQSSTPARIGFFYSPGTTDTNVETTPTDTTAFFSMSGNTCVYQTMTGPPTDTGSMANRFTLYCNNPAGATAFNVMGYRYVQA